MPNRNSYEMLEPLNPDQMLRLRRIVSLLNRVPVPWHEAISATHLYAEEETHDPLARAALSLLYETFRVWSVADSRRGEIMEISNSLTIETTHRLDHETVLDLLAYSARTDYWIEGYWEKFMASGDGILLFTRLLEHEEQLASESDSLS